jgi:hypothetical protein
MSTATDSNTTSKAETPPAHSRRTLFGVGAALIAGAGVLATATRAEPARGPDGALIALADEILALERESNRLGEEEDLLPVRERQGFSEKHIRPLTNRLLDLRDELALTPAVTMAGYRAKARVLQIYTNCAPGYAEPWQDDGLAWSLANDLLGVPSVWREDDVEDVA